MFYNRHKLSSLVCLILLGILFVYILLAEIESNESRDVSSSAVPSPKVSIEPTASAKILINKPIEFPDITYGIFYDIDISNDFITELNTYINQLNTALVSTEYTDKANKAMRQELNRLQNIKTAVESDINKYRLWENEYYYATKVWEYFMFRGYSSVVTAAIIGNMMIETSGGTLDLKPNIYSESGNYYGLCQWSLYYRPGIADLPFEYQLEYLEADMVDEFTIFGDCYKEGFTYEDFLSMTNPAEAALAFALVYERCKSVSHNARMEATLIAYDYFNLNK